MHLKARIAKPSFARSPGSSSTSIASSSRRIVRNQQRNIFTNGNTLKGTAKGETIGKLRRTALQALEKQRDPRAEKLIKNLLREDGYQPSQFFRRSVEYKLPTEICLLKELLPALDRGLFQTYYGPKDIGKTTAVNMALKGYHGVMYVTGDKWTSGDYSELFKDDIPNPDFEHSFESALRAYREATQDVAMLIMDDVVSQYNFCFLGKLHQRNLLDILLISNKVPDDKTVSYSMFPRMSDEELSQHLAFMSAHLGAKRLNQGIETPAPRWYQFWKRKSTPTPQEPRLSSFVPPLFSNAEVQEIVKKIGPDMDEVMACVSQAMHGRNIAEYISDREEQAAIKLFEKMDRLPQNVRDIGISYLNALEADCMQEMGVFNVPMRPKPEKVDLMDAIKRLGSQEILSFTSSQELTVSVPSKLVLKGHSRIIGQPFKFQFPKKVNLNA